jgi:GTP-binding protein
MRTRAARIRRASWCTVPDSYSRYLSNVFRKSFDLFATPVALEFRSDTNPFDRAKAAGKHVTKKSATHRNRSGKRDQKSLKGGKLRKRR